MKGNRLYSKSITYPDGRVMLEIRGCGRCYKAVEPAKRKCPRCGAGVPADKFIMASYDEREGVKKVVVKGCADCYGRR